MEINKSVERILKLKSVCNQTGLSRSTIYLKISENSFPKPIKLGLRGVGWLESEIAAWIQSRIELSNTK